MRTFAIIASLVAKLGIEVGFPQIVQLKLPAASWLVLAIFDHLCQLFGGKFLAVKSGVVVLQVHALQELLILLSVKQDALRKGCVPARPPTLLVVVFQWLGHSMMNHESDVRFVDPHPKGNSSDDYVYFVIHPFLLNCLFLLLINVCVVKSRSVSFFV